MDGTVGNGTLIVVLGPSGSGKDTVIDYARTALGERAEVMFVRRVVTRDAAAAAEDHDTLTEAEFAAQERAGAFAFTWNAHGLSYGWPRALDAHLQAGGVAIANGSRATLKRLEQKYRGLLPVALSVRADILAGRIAARGRESAAEITARLERGERFTVDAPGVVTIDNNGRPEAAGRAFLVCVESRLAALGATA